MKDGIVSHVLVLTLVMNKLVLQHQHHSWHLPGESQAVAKGFPSLGRHWQMRWLLPQAIRLLKSEPSLIKCESSNSSQQVYIR